MAENSRLKDTIDAQKKRIHSQELRPPTVNLMRDPEMLW